MNTELLKSKLLEAAFNGSLTHADTSTWECVQLGEIGTIVTGSTPSKANKEFYGNDYPFYKPGDLDQGINTDKSEDGLSKIGYEHARHLPTNSILVTCIGATIGKTGIIKREGSCNQQINAIIPNSRCNFLYVYYFIISPLVQSVIRFKSYSTTLPILNKTQFSQLEIPLPPLSEQERIVAALEEGFAYIDAVASAKQNLSDTAELLRSKILQAAFDGSLTGADTSTWKFVNLNDVCVFDSGYAFASGDYKKEGTPLVRISNIQNNEIDLTDAVCIQGDYPEQFILHKGDLLIAMSGATTGKMGVYKLDQKAYLNQRVGKIRIKDETVLSPEYRNYFFQNQTDNILKLAYGSAQPNISGKMILSLVVPLPPLAEQQRIVAKIEELFEQIDKITK